MPTPIIGGAHTTARPELPRKPPSAMFTGEITLGSNVRSNLNAPRSVTVSTTTPTVTSAPAANTLAGG